MPRVALSVLAQGLPGSRGPRSAGRDTREARWRRSLRSHTRPALVAPAAKAKAPGRFQLSSGTSASLCCHRCFVLFPLIICHFCVGVCSAGHLFFCRTHGFTRFLAVSWSCACLSTCFLHLNISLMWALPPVFHSHWALGLFPEASWSCVLFPTVYLENTETCSRGCAVSPGFSLYPFHRGHPRLSREKLISCHRHAFMWWPSAGTGARRRVADTCCLPPPQL